LSPSEQERIAGQNWSAASGVPEAPALFVKESSWWQPTRIRLAQRGDGACIFLDENGLCRIHAKFGEAAKPLACRIYPYAFHPAGNQLMVSLRFSCPSVAANRGRAVPRQRTELKQLAAQVLPAGYRTPSPPRLCARTGLDWDDTLSVVSAIDDSLAAEGVLTLKLIRILFWLELLAQAKFDKITGPRLRELLELLSAAAVAEISGLPSQPLAPSALGMSQFRLLAGQYARTDTAATIDTSWRGRWQQGQNALRLARGKGHLPLLRPDLASLPFSELERSCGHLGENSAEMLTRYFRVKVQGLHFCGPGYFGVPVVEGFQSLALVLPVVLWLARWKAASGNRDLVGHEDLQWGLTVADHQHGYSDAFGTWSARRRVKNLAGTGDLQKLIVWMTR
jgi:lysine-N-methylase